MKKNINLILLLILLLYLGCEKVTILPILGDIEGLVTDNNGQAVAGATVSVTYDAPTQFGPAEQRNASTTTNAEGYYQLTDLWDDVLLRIDYPGLESAVSRVTLKNGDRSPRIDLTLTGSPTIRSVTLEKFILLIDPNLSDSILFDVEVEDNYNSQAGSYQGNLLLEDAGGKTLRIIPATMTGQSLERVLLEGVITAGDLPAGSYQVNMEIIDPDGNTHRITTGERVRLE